MTAAIDKFSGADRLDWSGRITFKITPSDDAQLPYVTKALYVGSAGNVCVQSVDNAAANLPAVVYNCPQGTTLVVRAILVTAANTTANMNIVGLA